MIKREYVPPNRERNHWQYTYWYCPLRWLRGMFTSRPYVYFCQRLFRGWDDSDTWALNYTVAKFVVPRIRRFREIGSSYPCNITVEKWDEILADIQFAMEFVADDGKYNCCSEDDLDMIRYRKGMKLFFEYWDTLWD